MLHYPVILYTPNRHSLAGERKRRNTSICLYVYMSICLSVYLSIYLFIYLSVYLSICQSTHFYICLYVYLSLCLSVYLSICLSVYPSICLSICRFILYLYISTPGAVKSMDFRVFLDPNGCWSPPPGMKKVLNSLLRPCNIYLFIYLFVDLFYIYLSIYLPICRFILYLSIYLSMKVSI